MAFARGWNVAYTLQLSPGIGLWRVRPDIIEPIDAVCAAEEIELVAECNHSVISSGWWDLPVRWTAVYGVLNEDLPAIGGLLKRIQIESDQIIEEVALYLPAENVDLTSEDIEGMTVSSRWSWPRR